MTGRELSPAMSTAIVAEETDECPLYLITIEHPDLASPIRVANNVEDIVSNGQTFIGLPLDIELPDEGDRPGEARIRVDNVSAEITRAVRSIQGAPSVTIQVILASQPDMIDMEVSGLKLRDTTYDAAVVTGYLRFEDIVTEPVAEALTPWRFPGLH